MFFSVSAGKKRALSKPAFVYFVYREKAL